ncbi:MAG: hypothetical protein J6D34_09770 [Atopobiaceae bacterium]|nr:hypothetical protein [Atopobiaceae bacterium]
MADDVLPLSSEERAELEALRAEKAAREERERAARERAELEALRAESTERADAVASQRTRPTAGRQPRRQSNAEDLRVREARERGAKLMEPDDDLRMPLGQKVVLGVLALLVIIVVIMTFLVG